MDADLIFANCWHDDDDDDGREGPMVTMTMTMMMMAMMMMTGMMMLMRQTYNGQQQLILSLRTVDKQLTAPIPSSAPNKK